jgi:hypothetical protein
MSCRPKNPILGEAWNTATNGEDRPENTLPYLTNEGWVMQ